MSGLCPRCGDFLEGYPALSRTDNQTEVCSPCGPEEAVEQWQGRLTPQSEWWLNQVLSLKSILAEVSR